MAYHHLALAVRDMRAIHAFYEDVMGFELVKVEVAPVAQGGWAKHFFYRMDGDDSRFIAFWELHDVPGGGGFETNLSKAAGLPDPLNHIAFAVHSEDEFAARRERWTAAGLDVAEVDHNWCRSIYARDPSDNVVEFCLTTGAFDDADRARALQALDEQEPRYSPRPASFKMHKAGSPAEAA